jgi:glycosyltransferase involved in cell wall biosynthesis
MIFVMTTYNRPEFLKQTLESLMPMGTFPSDKFYIYDDASEPAIHKMLYEFEEKFDDPNLKIIVRPQHLGIHFNCTRSLYEAMEENNSDFVFNIDSDTIFHPEWSWRLRQFQRCLEEAKAPIGALSLFNTRSHPAFNNFNIDILIKVSVGGFGCLFRREPMKALVDKNIDKDWDWAYLEEAKKMGLKFYCSKLSYLEHIGTVGVNSGTGAYIDKALNFAPI